jgi:hypothetical protein
MAVQRPAYFISGHGEQTEKTFIIPEGCYIVVSEDVCMLADTDKFKYNFENVLKLDMDVISNPKENSDALIAALGSIAIYGPGDLCPDFSYQLFNVHFYKKGKQGVTEDTIYVERNAGSGIIDISSVKEEHVESEALDVIYHDTVLREEKERREEAKEYICGLYRHSRYPTASYIKGYLDMRWDRFPDASLFDMLLDLNRNRALETLQSQLCGREATENEINILNNSSNQKQRGPWGQHNFSGRIMGQGVYYHNICRGLPRRNTSGQILHNWRSGEKKIGENITVQNIIQSPVISSHFSEILLKRIPLLQKFVTSKNFKNRQKQMNENNCRNLANHIQEINEQIEKATTDKKYKKSEKKILRDTIIRLTGRNVFARTLQNKRETYARRAGLGMSTRRRRDPNGRNGNSTRSGRNRSKSGSNPNRNSRNRSPARKRSNEE